MDSQLIYRSAYFDSRKRSTGSNNSPVFNLDIPLKASHKLKIVSVNIPFSFYYFNGNFVIREENLTNMTISFQGNYTIDEICSQIQTQLNAQQTSGAVYTCSYSSVTGKIAIGANINTFKQVISQTNNIASKLGFTIGQQTGFFLVSANASKVSPQFVVLQSSELVQEVAVDSRSYYRNSSNNNIIMTVPMTNLFWQYNYYNAPQAAEYLTANGGDLTQISFNIIDDYGESIDFNGIPFTVKIGLLTSNINN